MKIKLIHYRRLVASIFSFVMLSLAFSIQAFESVSQITPGGSGQAA